MQQPDGKLFGVLADHVCRSLLRSLLRSKTPLTQKQLALELDISSGVISRKLAELETTGLVERSSSHSPYELLFRAETRRLLSDGANLAASALTRQAEMANAYARELTKEGLTGGNLLDQQQEQR